MMKYLDLKLMAARHAEEIQAAVRSVVDGGWYLKGEATRSFEEHYANYIGTRCCVGCGNGLDALTLVFRAYREMGVMKEGDEVIVPANTYIASILSITENGLVPVLVEPDVNTLQIDDSLIEQRISPRTRAVMIVHLYGRCAYTDKIGEICHRFHLKLIEDNAQAHGCTFGNRRTGSLGDVAGHSFYPTKNLGAMGDAGAVTTDDVDLAENIRTLGNYGSSRKYVFDYVGKNSRMDELQAAVLDVRLKYLDEDNRRRKEVASIYINKVKNPLVCIPQSQRDSVWHIFPVLSSCRDELQRYLLRVGVETQVHYPIPPHKQGCYSEWNKLSLPITEQIHREELSLPCHPGMTEEEVCQVVRLLNDFRSEHTL
ncbi:MAG: DegT/DnrJ/EryC1/StrS family aminotransferase [Prevotella sp.]|nr:DegT/DnrJ/EryC1/StrS family aminotransferase [Prevotella sp.]